MKKTIKKYLFLVVAVAALMVLFVSGASAVDKCPEGQCLYDSDLDVITPPACTTEGFTTMYCGVCKHSMGIKDRVNPTGHLFKEKDYKPESVDGGKYFHFFCICANDNCNAKTYRTREVNGEVQLIKYHTVKFVNPYGTAKYDTLYKDLAIEHKDVDLGTIYVEQGTAAEFTGTTPWRDKDKEPWEKTYSDGSTETVNGYGAYEFTGWKDSKGTLTKGNVIENITENSVFYAAFKGLDVQYVVNFVNGDGYPISTYITVNHGETDEKIFSLFENNPPKRSETSLYKFEFTGWDRDISAFYGSCTLIPQYKSIEKNYTYVYHGANGKEFYRTDMTASSTPPSFSDEMIETFIEKESDEKYIYTWTKEWCYNNVSYDIITPPTQIPGSLKENDEIHLYPVYARKGIEYELLVRISFNDINSYYSYDEFIVQVKNAEGQLVASGQTDEKGEFLCKVNYSKPLHITVTSIDNRCTGEAVVNYLFKFNTTVSSIRLDVKSALDNPAFSCHCLCHNTLIKPIWVRVLNILYNLFNIKYVCCDDMYASIGDLLVYTK